MSERRFQAVLLFGMPGVGKGTQGQLLGTIRGLFHLSTGAIFRSLADNIIEGRLVADRLRRGQLVPDDLTIEVWTHWLNAHVESGEFQPDHQVLLLDGIPRNVLQCERLNDIINVLQIIYFNPPSDEPMIQRLRQRALIEGRSDDADVSVIRSRFEVFRRDTAPVLNYYPKHLIREIDPMGSPAEVLKRILEQLLPVMAAVRGSTAECDGDANLPNDAE